MDGQHDFYSKFFILLLSGFDIIYILKNIKNLFLHFLLLLLLTPFRYRIAGNENVFLSNIYDRYWFKFTVKITYVQVTLSVN